LSITGKNDACATIVNVAQVGRLLVAGTEVEHPHTTMIVNKDQTAIRREHRITYAQVRPFPAVQRFTIN
jgi:hypothetical protein